MNDFCSADFKTILHSKRANLYYLEHCRVLVHDGRVEYVTDEGKRSLYWNIPIANTTTVLLGTGTSVTQAAMRELAKAGVMVGFCGGGGTPLFSVNEFEQEVAWFAPQSEYRPTEYLQHWVRFWFDDGLRLAAAKALQSSRLRYLQQHWGEHARAKAGVFSVPIDLVAALVTQTTAAVAAAPDVTHLLALEGRLTKQLYKLAAHATQAGEFTRSARGESRDPANAFLDHGNYLAYGLGATATWVLGLPAALAVLHGKTRRGGLVFDAADLVKDAIVLPQSFISAARGDTEQEFRQACIEQLTRKEALDFMIDTLKAIALETGRLAALGTSPGAVALSLPAASGPSA
ncbi:type I-F CRISPR-associated endonuclease Cas1f [Polaromonas sp.]|uniref:type I-F CRISPR-associated endonuclease Cas1f n=1 Tax=Polaromonas sp. TaxID=1869339 RepID=UPI0018391C12|nr:type I-F CRISPR-associated endonuclease Cas1f [Polaromonas sp.]NML87279.1 type I-F CRISPR-associated endonuclease Cas1 [Polaromonas sp.]